MTTPDQPQYAPAAPKPASAMYIRQADAIIAGGALIMFLFSFAPFVSANGYHKNAWTFWAPVALFIVFAAIALLATAFLDTFWHRDKQLVGLHRHHLQVGLALYTLVTLFSYAIADKNGLGFGWGGVFMLIGSLAATAGAVLNHFGQLQGPISLPAKSATPAAVYPPQNYAPPAAQQGYAQPTQQGYTPPPAQGYTPPPAPTDPTLPPTV
jgi:hypothetical protein